ncbi:MAG TPA: hypothetical protein VN840_11940 [Streptosporangiaceae bacterium]|nr:hypothetical protein [Streptosporangiaceae bacterium]
MPRKVNRHWEDPEIGESYVLEWLGEQDERNRFRIKGTSIEFECAPSKYYFAGKLTTIEDIRKRLGVLSTGLGALAEFHAKGNTPENRKVTRDGEALHEQYYELLRRGIGGDSPKVYEDLVAGKPWKLTDLGRIFGFDELEERAMYAYSQPNKNVQFIGEGNTKKVNPVYMFSHPQWGKYFIGWSALESALTKIPNLGELGLGSVPTYRVERSGSELMKYLREAEGPAYIYHGLQTTGTKRYDYWPDENSPTWSAEVGNQPHYASASIMPSSHSWQQKAYKNGLIKFYCPSAKYINAWGGMGIVDGGEVLIPPRTITYYSGSPITETWMGTDVTMYVLTEFTGQRRKGIPFVDDHTVIDVDL